MNEKLKFSWFNILTFLALIAVGYTCFVGLTYMTDGNFMTAGIGTAIIVVLIAAYFIFLQNIKATAFYVQRRIKYEAAMLIFSPVIFAVLALPSTHFWTVNSQNEEITKCFKQSINGAKQLFTDYEKYSDARITAMRDAVSYGSAQIDSLSGSRIELTYGLIDVQIDNMTDILRLQLLSDNYTRLRDAATTWIDKSNVGASTWNVFILGNTREIKTSLRQWENELNEMAHHRMTAENVFNLNTNFQSDGAENAIKGIDTLTDAFTTRKFPGFQAWIYCIVIYLMLLLPYIFQSRNARNPYRLTDVFSEKPHRQSTVDAYEETDDTDETTQTRNGREKRFGKKAKADKNTKKTEPDDDDEFDENGGFTL